MKCRSAHEEIHRDHGFLVARHAAAVFLQRDAGTLHLPQTGFAAHLRFGAGADQHQDAGAKILHLAPNTTSVITSKSISKDGGRTSYRGLIKVLPGATGVKSKVRCDALLMDEHSRSDTYPTMQIDEDDVNIGHEATVRKIADEQLFYLMRRGLTEQEATLMIVNGFIEEFTKELPMEYSVELNRLIQLEMEGSIG